MYLFVRHLTHSHVTRYECEPHHMYDANVNQYRIVFGEKSIFITVELKKKKFKNEENNFRQSFWSFFVEKTIKR